MVSIFDTDSARSLAFSMALYAPTAAAVPIAAKARAAVFAMFPTFVPNASKAPSASLTPLLS